MCESGLYPRISHIFCFYHVQATKAKKRRGPGWHCAPLQTHQAAMGMFFSKIWSRMVSTKDMRILMLGLDAAGKTTILYRFKLAEVIHTVPTIGFNVETVEYKNIKFDAFCWSFFDFETFFHLFLMYIITIEKIFHKSTHFFVTKGLLVKQTRMSGTLEAKIRFANSGATTFKALMVWSMWWTVLTVIAFKMPRMS